MRGVATWSDVLMTVSWAQLSRFKNNPDDTDPALMSNLTPGGQHEVNTAAARHEYGRRTDEITRTTSLKDPAK